MSQHFHKKMQLLFLFSETTNTAQNGWGIRIMSKRKLPLHDFFRESDSFI